MLNFGVSSFCQPSSDSEGVQRNRNLCDIKRQSDLGLVAVLCMEVFGPKSLESRIHVPCFCTF